jgi:hypothetical protein
MDEATEPTPRIFSQLQYAHVMMILKKVVTILLEWPVKQRTSTLVWPNRKTVGQNVSSKCSTHL